MKWRKFCDNNVHHHGDGEDDGGERALGVELGMMAMADEGERATARRDQQSDGQLLAATERAGERVTCGPKLRMKRCRSR